MNKKRPIGVWVIFVLNLMMLAALAFSHYLIHTGAMPLSDEQRSFFASQTFVDHILTFTGPLAAAVAGCILFVMSRFAVQALWASLLISPLLTLIHYVSKGAPAFEISGAFGTTVSMLLGIAVKTAMLIYSMRLFKLGKLK